MMSLKSIEMQVAIPRSQDAGRMQEQMSKQSQQFQETLTKQQLREEVLKRSKVNEYDDVQNLNVDDEDQETTGENKQEQRQRKKEEQQEQVEHPYLGNTIDFSG